ncbi:hypothetical protein ABIE41_002369 [Bosea sp. OAE506]
MSNSTLQMQDRDGSGNLRRPCAFHGSTTPLPRDGTMMDDDRINRIARALCRSARIDPDGLLSGEGADPELLRHDVRGQVNGRDVPAWTMFRGAALTFIQAHEERVVAPL